MKEQEEHHYNATGPPSDLDTWEVNNKNIYTSVSKIGTMEKEKQTPKTKSTLLHTGTSANTTTASGVLEPEDSGSPGSELDITDIDGLISDLVYRRQNRPEEALNQCEKSLQLLQDSNKPEKTCSVYKNMAAIEQGRGHLDRAVQHLSKAHAIAMTHSPEGLEGAQISHSLALILSAAEETHDNDTAGLYFEQSLSAHKKSVGTQDPAYLNAQDDFCRFLLINGQQEKCVDIQRAALDSKRSAFGDLSSEVADTLQLIGSVEMTEGKLNQAHRTMSKCLKIQSLLYGPQHKKTKAVQKAVDMLARTPEVVEGQQRRTRRKKQSDTSLVLQSSGDDKNS